MLCRNSVGLQKGTPKLLNNNLASWKPSVAKIIRTSCIIQSHDNSGFSTLQYAPCSCKAAQQLQVKATRELPVFTSCSGTLLKPVMPSGHSVLLSCGHLAQVNDLHGVPKWAATILPERISCRITTPWIKTSKASPWLTSQGLQVGTRCKTSPSVRQAVPAKTSMAHWPSTLSTSLSEPSGSGHLELSQRLARFVAFALFHSSRLLFHHAAFLACRPAGWAFHSCQPLDELPEDLAPLPPCAAKPARCRSPCCW